MSKSLPDFTRYKRVLPEPSVGFSTKEGRTLFKKALQDGTMECYFPLAEQFTTQAEPAYCGLSTLVMVLNALAVDPRRRWKGIWRWYDENLLDCCVPLEIVQSQGVVMKEWACLARCQGLEVEEHSYDALSLEDFRAMLLEHCSRDGSFLVATYSRKELNQIGDGHFSPIAGYHAESDMVLILDVARFKYPPHWVPASVLHAAMAHRDKTTGNPRGLLVVRPSLPPSVLLTCGSPRRCGAPCSRCRCRRRCSSSRCAAAAASSPARAAPRPSRSRGPSCCGRCAGSPFSGSCPSF
uniref:glutathione gamma-glutamylcysteinyltransferase n=1 Tax=Tetraselmis sp. GSL018 TaxID=582737 RepID=A0A061RJX9_9CHLO